MIRPGSGCQWFTRRRLQLSLAVAVVIACIYTILPASSRPDSHAHTNNEPPQHHKLPFTSPSYARSLSARELISRPRSADLVSLPKLIHQTWFPAGSNMSENAQLWVQTMRAQNPDWEYVLWDDETNRLLVETHFPWFLKDYLRLPKEILRADVVRNLYMFLFGGMYADVDTEALRPVDSLFAGHDTPLRAAHSSLLGSWTGKVKAHSPHDSSTITQRAFLGHMAHQAGLDGPAAVPNGWMASPPGHPFWLLPVIHVIENPNGSEDGSVESLTGPTALSFLLHRYFEDFEGDEKTVRRHVCQKVRRWSPQWEIYCGPEGHEDDVPELQTKGAAPVVVQDKMVILPRQQIYPYSWEDDKMLPACLAAFENPQFDPEACKRAIDVEAWPSYFITYCTHSW
ncbi:hypothetical protein BO82DRAFT_326161 [Aspergillus uvarum CBS 121591]|uniref:Glycosyl transferase n=1 Tax=Aspergillus uvarum CBS 121591 TaxID=1448315 RepID=A0A319CKI5_9EURO|nr:hypothetical protein BO82DRAFT_326161 [Aspergillus uvarum CBS 121591]PYH86095.1 hypothetical protein BO82DRAFT_326161 [Aspergillus uvarum CBS 121591]